MCFTVWTWKGVSPCGPSIAKAHRKTRANSMAVDLLGRVVEAASGQRLTDLLDERVFKPLKMRDTAFWVPPGKISRLAQPLAVDLASGQAIKVIEVSKEPKNDSGGAGAVSTAGSPVAGRKPHPSSPRFAG
jgi:CubicO group peptidase (beta-lactamase class C family)